MEAGGMVSRRTRSRLDAYYRHLHHTIKNNPIPSTKDAEKIHQDSDESVISGDDEEMNKKKKRKIVAAKKVGRPPKKRAPSLDLLEGSENHLEVRESGLPLKFKFDNDDDDKSHKTQWEMEIDSLFNDLEVGLWESQSATASSCVIDDVDQTPAARCSRNDHDQYLDEQIGICCRFCHTLLLHIKYVFPPFCLKVESESESESPNRWQDSKPKNLDLNPSDSLPNLESTNIPSTPNGTVFDLIPAAAGDRLYPHQLEAFEFMWRNIGGDTLLRGLQTLPAGGGRGCIISHAPGTGKTRLTIVFLQSLLRLHPTCRPLLIAPRGMLLTWELELQKWGAAIPFYNLNHHSHEVRRARILAWAAGGSILAVGYRLFEELTAAGKSGKFGKYLLEYPSLAVLDEGHTPRNHQTLIWKVLTKLKTRRRVILSGTPFQNNFNELYNTLSLINPQFSDLQFSWSDPDTTLKGRRNWANLTRDDEGIKKLREMIKPFVHIHKGTILHKTLPGLKDSLIILKPTPLQQKLLQQNSSRVQNFLEESHLASLISLHPSLAAGEPAFSGLTDLLKSLESDPTAGVKTHFLINLIEISSRIDEKVLVFSEFIKPLLHIMELLGSHLGYRRGREVVYIDGDVAMRRRQRVISSFNERRGEARVLLASQRACCEGISLVGASRVVLLDVSWNPAVERQAVSRAYRLGQERVVHVYHLMTAMEVGKYARQAEKERVSELVFGEGVERERERGGGVWEDRVLEAMVEREGGGDMFERIVHRPKESDFVKDFGFCGS